MHDKCSLDSYSTMLLDELNSRVGELSAMTAKEITEYLDESFRLVQHGSGTEWIVSYFGGDGAIVCVRQTPEGVKVIPAKYTKVVVVCEDPSDLMSAYINDPKWETTPLEMSDDIGPLRRVSNQIVEHRRSTGSIILLHVYEHRDSEKVVGVRIEYDATGKDSSLPSARIVPVSRDYSPSYSMQGVEYEDGTYRS